MPKWETLQLSLHEDGLAAFYAKLSPRCQQDRHMLDVVCHEWTQVLLVLYEGTSEGAVQACAVVRGKHWRPDQQCPDILMFVFTQLQDCEGADGIVLFMFQALQDNPSLATVVIQWLDRLHAVFAGWNHHSMNMMQGGDKLKLASPRHPVIWQDSVLNHQVQVIAKLMPHGESSQASGQDKTRQDKRLHLFQPAWLIRCLSHRLDQHPALFSHLHPETEPLALKSGCHMNCCIVVAR